MVTNHNEEEFPNFKRRPVQFRKLSMLIWSQ